MAGQAGFYGGGGEGIYDLAKRKFNENLQWSGEVKAPQIGAPAAPAPAKAAPFEAPGQTVQAFPRENPGTSAPSRRSAMAKGVRESPRQGPTPGLRAGADRIAFEIGDRPSFSGNHSIADLESGDRASQFLEGLHQNRVAEIGANDPYERARASERQSDVDRLLAEDTGLVDAENDPGITEIGGVYRTSRRSPRQSGAERKKSIETQRQAGYGFDRARSAEREKSATEQARRSAFMRATVGGLDQEYAEREKQLSSTLTGDQLRVALDKLNAEKRAAYNDAVTNAFQIGARFDLR